MNFVKRIRIRIFSSPYFPAFALNTETTPYLSAFIPNVGKYGPEISKYEHFLRSMKPFTQYEIYFLKPYIATAGYSKKLNNGGTNLTHVNYGIINDEIKLIDSLKFYQKSLSELSSTLTKEEKKVVKHLTKQLFNQHYYFSTV